MPIKDKSRYPADWPEISLRIRTERASGVCEWCGAENGKPHPVTGGKVTLTVAHLNHNPTDCRDENLKALCNKCHNTYDRTFRNVNRKLNQWQKQLAIPALPARVPSSRWWLDGNDGPAMTRLLNELHCQGPSLWRVPLRATGCQNASEMDRRNLDYDSVKTACRKILAAEKLLDATIGALVDRYGEHKNLHTIGLVLPARCGQVVKIEQLPLQLAA